MNIKEEVARLLAAPPLKLRASGAGLGAEKTFEFSNFVLVDRRIVIEMQKLVGAPNPTIATNDVEDDVQQVIARLRATDGKNHDSCIVTWTAAQEIVKEIDRLRDIVEDRQYDD